ncbi:MAG: PEP-CTERM sorting domain-containing protein [Phycisphaerae bacterium]
MAVASSAVRAEVVYSTGFENPAATDLWQLNLAPTDTLSGVTTTEAHSGQSSILLNNAYTSWSTLYTVGTLNNDYERISYYSKGPGVALLDYRFQSAPSTDWQLNQIVTRVYYGYGCAISSKTNDPVYVDDLKMEIATGADAATWSDGVYASLPVHIVPPAPVNQLANIPNTINALHTGKPLNILMVGDSIVNDTWTSNWDTLVQRNNPGSKVDAYASVRGGGGANFYKLPGNVQKYILQYDPSGTSPYQPNVIMIGGISNGDAASVRDVVQQIRAAGSTAEIILMDMGAGSQEWYPLTTDWNAPIDPNGTDYRSQLYKVALEEHTGFIDMSAVWGRYLQDLAALGQDDSILKRDAIHTNQYGQAVMARAIESYFATYPAAAPEPASLSLLALGGLAFWRRRR